MLFDDEDNDDWAGKNAVHFSGLDQHTMIACGFRMIYGDDPFEGGEHEMSDVGDSDSDGSNGGDDEDDDDDSDSDSDGIEAMFD